MRQARIRPREEDTFVHLCNRIAGPVGDYPFGNAEKEFLLRLLHDLTRLYTVEPVAYQLMGNHFHVLLFVPGEALPQAQAVERFNRYYRGKRVVEPNSPRAEALPEKLRDISAFMHALEQGFARWFNRTRSPRRRGHLWADRFKSVIVEKGASVWHCWKYIELNCVRARLVRRAEDYRFGSFGVWAGKGRHPFAETIRRRVLPTLPPELGVRDMAGLFEVLRKRLAAEAAEILCEPATAAPTVGRSAEKERLTLSAGRRVRYWVDGLVIGSELFVKTTVARVRGEAAVQRRRLVRALGSDPAAPPPIYSFKQLRRIV